MGGVTWTEAYAKLKKNYQALSNPPLTIITAPKYHIIPYSYWNRPKTLLEEALLLRLEYKHAKKRGEV